MSFFGDIFGGKAAQAAANYNAKIMERNAQIKEQEAEQIMSVHNNYSLPRFDKSVEQIQGQTTVAYLSSGAAYSGTVIEALYANELELQTDRDIMTYNAENARDTALNEAIQKELMRIFQDGVVKLLRKLVTMLRVKVYYQQHECFYQRDN